MKALVYQGKGKIAWCQAPDPQIINDTDIIVKIAGFTFSHADYRPYLGHDDSVAINTIMGHEGVGTISAVGTGVKKLKVGDRVAIGCIIHCNQCQWCHIQAYANCLNGGFILGSKINGTHAEYVRVPFGENSVIKIPQHMSLAAAVMLCDVLSTAYENVISKIDVNKIQNAAIVGDGPIGLAVFLFLKMHNKPVTIYGHHASKLQYFQKLGAVAGFDSGQNLPDQKYDLVVESVGNDRGTFELAQRLINFNGTIITIGVFNHPVTFYLNQLWHQNITIHTGILNVVALPQLVKMITNKQIHPEQIASKIYNKHQALEAYHSAMTNRDYFKVVVNLDKS